LSNGWVFFHSQRVRGQSVAAWDKTRRVFDRSSTLELSRRKMSKSVFLSRYMWRLFMKQRGSSVRSARVAVRLSKEEQRQVEEAAKTKGYANPSAFIRAAIRNELDGRAELTGTDERMGAGFDRVSHDIFRVGRGQQALFALLDAFAKAVLTCVPEPPPDARQQAIARARDRYDRLVKAAGQAMSGDARAAMKDLVDHGTN
jgi:Arc/MetJ-type ribon-helix-helix transcriptional regulator